MTRPVTEYACHHPGVNQQQRNGIELIQKRVLHIIYPDTTYEEALNLLNLERLQTRREHLCKTMFVTMQNERHRLFSLLSKPRLKT